MTEYELSQLPQSETGQRMYSRVSPIYENSFFIKQYYDAIGKEWEPVRNYFTTLHEQRFIQTVSWGIEYLERKYSLDPRPDLDLEARRRRLGIKAFTKYPLNPAVLEEYARTHFDLNVYIDESQAGYINLIANHFDLDNFNAYLKFLLTEKPAHLALKGNLYFFEYIGTGTSQGNDDGVVYVPPDIGLPEGDGLEFADYVPLPTDHEDAEHFPRIFFGMAEVQGGEEIFHMPLPPDKFSGNLKIGIAQFVSGDIVIGADLSSEIECPVYVGGLEVLGGEIIINAEIEDEIVPYVMGAVFYIKECPVADLLTLDVGIARGYILFDFDIPPEAHDVVKLFFKFPISKHRRYRAITLPNPRKNISRAEMKAIGDYVAEKKLVMNEQGEYSNGVFAAALKTKTVTQIF